MKINMMKHSLAIIKQSLINALDQAEQIYYAIDLYTNEENKKDCAEKGCERLEKWIMGAAMMTNDLKKETYEED